MTASGHAEGTAALRQTTQNLTALCALVARMPTPERLETLAALNRSFTEIHDDARRDAIYAARRAHWPLRRIAAALRCSHEQVRLLAR